MTTEFTFCGFATRTEALVFERTLACDVDAVKAALNPAEIADDPGIANCYLIAVSKVEELVGESGIPAGDYYVNAVALAFRA